jgi:tRNA(fMet)-specific endonuclease VapC
VTMRMLDTDISSYIIKRRPESLIERFETHAQEICVSAITAAELRFGAEKAGRPKLAQEVEEYLKRLTILNWPDAATPHYARIRAALERAGTPIGNMDLMIAAHAIAERATVVTNNVKHFSAVPGLKLEQWT